MICGICKEREGERITLCFSKEDGTTAECECYACQPHRCKDCIEFWGKSPSTDGVARPMHKKPQRRKAVLATRRRL